MILKDSHNPCVTRFMAVITRFTHEITRNVVKLLLLLAGGHEVKTGYATIQNGLCGHKNGLRIARFLYSKKVNIMYFNNKI
jgi:hypothetical protein